MYLNSDTLRRNAGTEHNETKTTDAHCVSVHSVLQPRSAADSYVHVWENMENTLNTILEQMQSDTTATFKPYMVLVCKKKNNNNNQFLRSGFRLGGIKHNVSGH